MAYRITGPDIRSNREFAHIYEQFKIFRSRNFNLNFSGSSPPDIFVGRYNYPNVFTGILSPAKHSEESYKLSSPEEWFKAKLSTEEILLKRGQLIYSRFNSHIKTYDNKLTNIMQEVSMAQKPLDLEFYLKKRPIIKLNLDNISAPLTNLAELRKAKITENPKIPKKVDYLVSDYDLKAENAIMELYKGKYTVTSMIKLLSAGLLGLKHRRKLVPSRWSTSAIDSIISKNLLKKIKTYPWINEFMVFSDEYLGNHYEFLLLPRHWSFEVIEAKVPGSIWNLKHYKPFFMIDYEGIYDRKTYASSVTGAYYSNRLGAAEYLNKIKRQSSVLVLREVRPEYNVPLGVGILREVTRDAFTKKPNKFSNLEEALEDINKRLNLNVNDFIEKSGLIKEYKQQSSLNKFF